MDKTIDRPIVAVAADTERRRGRWLDERLGIGAFYRKYGRKAFPVHSTFFFGEMALFSFVILVLTGVYLGLIYVPSNAVVTVDGEDLPQAYASVQLIESIPVANLFRNVHHWAAHLMVASLVLHTVRIFFTGTYRKPREVNWVIGVVLLGLTLMAGFVGYALPYDAYAVTATGIGYGIARSIPWVGATASELFFGGAFPTLGSLPRLYTIHVFVVPALIGFFTALHLLLVVKQKHTQPGYARKAAEPGKVLGVPLWPYQALLGGQLLFLMFGGLFLLSALVPAHPLDEYGPPGPATSEVKPDWHLLWIFGFLKILPAWVSFDVPGSSVGANFIGGLLFPALVFGVITLAPFLDRTNRRAIERFEYLEPPRQASTRCAIGFALPAFLGTLFLAAYYDEIGITLGQIWAVVVLTPLVVGVGAYLVARRTAPAARFDPREAPAGAAGPAPATPRPIPTPAPMPAPLAAEPPTGDAVVSFRPARDETPIDESAFAPTTIAARGERARESLIAAMRELGAAAPAVEQLRGDDLLEAIGYVDSLRLSLAESAQLLEGVVRGERAEEEP